MLYTGAPQTGNRVQKSTEGAFVARPYRPTYATADASVLPRASALLPDGMGQPTLVRGGVQHVDTPGVHMLGHLEDAIELVIQGRFASRPRQRVVT